MNYEIKIVELHLLKQHEQICQLHLEELAQRIKKCGHIKNPIIVDKNTMVVLDGHHRLNSAKMLGLKKIPACLVEYEDKNITVSSWRRGRAVTKSDVLNAGLSGKLLEPKTSRHSIPNRPKGVMVSLSELK